MMVTTVRGERSGRRDAGVRRGTRLEDLFGSKRRDESPLGKLFQFPAEKRRANDN